MHDYYGKMYYEIIAYNVGTNDTFRICTGHAVKIIAQPTDTLSIPGGVATFSITASGDDLSYQWEISSDGGKTWRKYDSASPSCSIITNPGTDAFLFRCVVSNDQSAAISDPVRANIKAMNEVTINDIMLVKNDLSSVIRFVDLFDPNDIYLTEAQLKAIEIVLEHDYSAKAS